MPTPSLDSVRIENTTGLALVVTIQLEVPQVQQPTITETIPAQGNSICRFDFGSATDAFMTMDVSRGGGGPKSAPVDNSTFPSRSPDITACLFTISLFGPYFSVNVPS